ncbi:unnamed protein product, partial [Mesorhabditis spiculigera]
MSPRNPAHFNTRVPERTGMKPCWYIWFRAVGCTFEEADHIYIEDEHGTVDFCEIHKMKNRDGHDVVLPDGDGNYRTAHRPRFFTYRKVAFVWFADREEFLPISELDSRVPLETFYQILHAEKGLSDEEVSQRQAVYGKNLIEVVLRSILVLLFCEAISPFYIFQVFSVGIWYSDEYQIYASIIVLMSLTSISLDVIQTRKQETKLRSMVHSSGPVDVVRNGGQVTQLDSSQLVPGDTILVPQHGGMMHCDAVLMTGTVIINESMLTGECVPVTKVALTTSDDHQPEDTVARFDFSRHSKHVLYCGTQVLQTRYYGGKPVRAIVLRTAYSTTKGQLMRSVMYPKPVDFQFTKDLFKFIGFLVSIACVGFAYTVGVMVSRGQGIFKIIVRASDLITIVVPPALPAAITLVYANAQIRLKRKDIFCISPSTIPMCGSINTVCFDKTGTLTEDGLDFHTMRAVKPAVTNAASHFGAETSEMLPRELPRDAEIIKAVATCHSLTRINGVLHGDPLDLILFNQSRWTIDENCGSERSDDEISRFDTVQPTVVKPPPEDVPIFRSSDFAVIRQFTFSSSLQRMSVIVNSPVEETGRKMTLYSKGSPEMILSLCDKTTVPEDYLETVNKYAQHGYRLIAVAKRDLVLSFAKAQKVPRHSVETGLELLGLIVMENRLKPQSLPVINELNRANIRAVMVTGDNLLTALSVGRECGIIRPNRTAYLVEHQAGQLAADGRTQLTLRQSVSSSEDILDEQLNSDPLSPELQGNYQLCIAGPTFAVVCHEYPELMDNLMTVCDVFARMSPDQKQFLVNHLQTLDYIVAMCGDGANDCAALKAAHAGISLSDAEASIAAPFTSKIPDIRCVPIIIREGRAALVTAFAIFKYMAGYSLTQFVTILQLYWIGTNLTDGQFLFIDLFIITVNALFFGAAEAYDTLCSKPPPRRLLSPASMVSVLGQLTIMLTTQLFIFVWTSQQTWFIPFVPSPPDEEEIKRSQQGTALFGVSVFQYLTLVAMYSKGSAHRKSIFTNRYLCLTLFVTTVASFYVVLFPADWVAALLDYVKIPDMTRVFVVLIAAFSSVLSFIFNLLVVEHLIGNMGARWLKQRRLRDPNAETDKWERIMCRIGHDVSWLRKSVRQIGADQASIKSGATVDETTPV